MLFHHTVLEHMINGSEFIINNTFVGGSQLLVTVYRLAICFYSRVQYFEKPSLLSAVEHMASTNSSSCVSILASTLVNIHVQTSSLVAVKHPGFLVGCSNGEWMECKRLVTASFTSELPCVLECLPHPVIKVNGPTSSKTTSGSVLTLLAKADSHIKVATTAAPLDSSCRSKVLVLVLGS